MRAILWRLLGSVPTLFGVVLATFLLTRVLPGDPAVFFASNPSMTAEDIERVLAAGSPRLLNSRRSCCV